MPSYKLTYFKNKGRAEVARMLFTLAGEKFEDNRLTPEEWAELKPTVPMEQIPVLEVDDTIVCQSNAISRYLARQYGYAGSTPLEESRVDMVADSLEDMYTQMVPIVFSEGDEKIKYQKRFTDDRFPFFMKKLEVMVASNPSGFFVGDKMTWADMKFAVETLMFPAFFGMTVTLDDYPHLKALVAKVEADPKIAAWIESRPETEF